MSLLDKFRGKKIKKEAATMEGGILLIPAIFPANASEFPDYLILNAIQIIEKGYPFIKMSQTRADLFSLLDLQMGYNVARGQYDVEVVLKFLDTFAKSKDILKVLAITNKNLYSGKEPRSPFLHGKAGKYGVVVSIYPLEFKIHQHMNPYFDDKVKGFVKEFQVDVESYSKEDLYRLYWLGVQIFQKLGYAFGLPHSRNNEDIMFPCSSVREVFKRGYKMPESGPLLNDILRKQNLNILDKSSPLVSTQEYSQYDSI